MNLRVRDGDIESAAREQLGIEDLSSVVETDAVKALVPMALTAAHIVPAFPPPAPKGSILHKGSSFNFELIVMPKPHYELASYEAVSFEAEPYTPDKPAVERELAQFAEHFANYVTDPDCKVVAPKSSCLLSVEAYANGEPVGAVNTEGRTYTLGEGLMPEGFDEGIIGMEVGQTRSFSFQAPDYDKGPGAVLDVECTVCLKEMQKIVSPELTDEWVAKNLPDIGSYDNLLRRITEQVEAPRKASYQHYLGELAADQLSERFKGSISDDVYTTMIRSMQSSLHDRARQEGVTYDEYVEKLGGQQQVNMMLMVQARQTLVRGYCLDAVFRHEGLKADNEDVMEACRSLDPNSPMGVRKWMQDSYCSFVVEEIAERLRAARWLVEHAQITQRPSA